MNHSSDHRQESCSPTTENNQNEVISSLDRVATIPTNRLLLFIYLIPVIGFFPSLWTLYRRQAGREHLAASRLSVTLALTWLCCYVLLDLGADADFSTLRLLILNSFLTSGYFLVSLWLMFRLVRGKPARLPGFSRWAAQLDEHLH